MRRGNKGISVDGCWKVLVLEEYWMCGYYLYTMLYIFDFIKKLFKNQRVPFQNTGQWNQLFLKD